MDAYRPHAFKPATPVRQAARPSNAFCRWSPLEGECALASMEFTPMGSDLWIGHGLRRYKASNGLERFWLDRENQAWEYLSKADHNGSLAARP